MNTQEPAVQRSVLPTVFGYLHASLAGVGILMTLGGALMAPVMEQLTGKPLPNPLRDRLGASGYLAWMVGSVVLGVAWKALMGWSGILLIKGRDQGRTLGNVWAVGSIIIGTVMAVLSACWIMPMVFDAQAKAGGPAKGAEVFAAMKWIMVAFSLLMGLAMAWVYQICALVFLNKPAAKAALR